MAINENIINILNEYNITENELTDLLKQNSVNYDIYGDLNSTKIKNIKTLLETIYFSLKSESDEKTHKRKKITDDFFNDIDINEDLLYKYSPELLELLLADRTTGKNIIWGTDDYETFGSDCKRDKEIKPELITGDRTGIIRPRVKKAKEEKDRRTKEKAEVFTPSWVCNKQNNLVDNAWFGVSDLFNTEKKNGWETHKKNIVFPEYKTWKDYITDTRLEITCGEAPYLVSRYDTVNGNKIKLYRRIGLLDRKMRVICENTDNKHRINWMTWTKKAYQNIYGYDFQGDNVLLAREALLASFYEYYKSMNFGEPLLKKELLEIGEIISWNIWQMDGLTMMPPFEEYSDNSNMNTFDFENGGELAPVNNYSKIMDWEEGKIITFKSIGESNE